MKGQLLIVLNNLLGLIVMYIHLVRCALYLILLQLFACFSAGVGRTGTYIALDMLVEESNKPTSSESQKDVDIFSCVNHLRKQRVAMVQTHVSE